MILNYYGKKILVNAENSQFKDLIKEKYTPVIAVSEEKSEYMFTVDLKINKSPLFTLNKKFKRRIIHGGNKKEYYLTGIEKEDENCKYIYVDKYKVFLQVYFEEKRIVCQGNQIEDVFKIFDIVIIELFFRTIEKYDNSFHFHASAISDEQGNVVIFLGNKNAGKTTFLLESILHYNYRYVCNDNCFVGVGDDNNLFMIPWFEDLKIKKSTMKKFNCHFPMHIENECSEDGTKVFVPLSKAIKECDFEYMVPLKLQEIVILEYNNRISNVEPEWKSSYREDIRNNIKMPHDPEHYEFLGLFDEFSDDRFDKLEYLLDVIEQKIKITKITYNNDSYSRVINEFMKEKKRYINLICRKEAENDYDEIEEVIKTDKYRPWKKCEDNEWVRLRRFRKSNQYKEELSIVAQNEEMIVGHIILCETEVTNLQPGQHFLFFLQQAIHIEYQGVGVGTTLIQFVETEAKEKGYLGIAVLGHDDFFAKLGYVKVSSTSDVEDKKNLFVKVLDDKFKWDNTKHQVQICKL